MNLGDCLDIVSAHLHCVLATLPMGQAGHYFGFYILLYVLPLFAFNWRPLGQYFPEVTRGHIGKDPPLLHRVIVVNDWRAGQTGREAKRVTKGD